MKTRLVTHLRTRGRLVALTLGLGAFAHACEKLPRERSLEALNELVGEASQSQASAGAWEPSRGALLDLLDGRGFLFLGRAGSQNDVRRAFVRVAPDGVPLGVTRTRNLTDTAIADEQSLTVRGSRAVFATTTSEDIHAVTLLDTNAAPRPASLRLSAEARARAEHALESFLTTGSARGIARVDLVFDRSPRELSFTLSSDALELSFGERAVKLTRPSNGERLSAQGEDPQTPTATVLVRDLEPLPFGELLERAAGAVLGAPRVDALETTRLWAKDRVRRLSHALFGSNERARPSSELRPQRGAAQLGASGEASHPWPPPVVPSVFDTPRDGEGSWVAVPLQGAAASADEPVPLFYRTFVRADRGRPQADVVLVVMDMRRLELAYQAGAESPKPSASVPGAGHIANTAGAPSRIVALFNGVTSAQADPRGAVVERRVLVPPVSSAPTLRIDRSGRVGLGPWTKSSAAAPLLGPSSLPDELLSLRQGLRPLVVAGELLEARGPGSGRSLASDVVSERSAACVTDAGHLLYAWASSSTERALAEALRLAGCDYALSLSERPGDALFALTNVAKLSPLEARAERIDSRMRANETRYLEGSRRDFFYVSLRESAPLAGDFAWRVDAGAQPPPAGLAAVFSGEKPLGALSVALTRFEAGRFAYRVSAAEREATTGIVDHELPSAERERLLAAIGLGYTTDATRYGLAIAGSVAVPFQRALGTLVFPKLGSPYVVPPGEPFELPQGAEAVQLPLLAQAGELTPRAKELGALRRRGALCIDGAGNLLVARLTHDSSAPAARVLHDLGCALVLEMDRGSHSAPTVERAGAGDGIPALPSSTVLYLLARGPEARAYTFGAASTGP